MAASSGEIAPIAPVAPRIAAPPTAELLALFETATALGRSHSPGVLVNALERLCAYALDSSVLRADVDARVNQRAELRAEIYNLAGDDTLSERDVSKRRDEILVELGGRALSVRSQAMGEDRRGNKYWWAAHAPDAAQQDGGGGAAVRGLHTFVQLAGGAAAHAEPRSDGRAPLRWARIARGSGPGEADARHMDDLIAYLQPNTVKEGPLRFGLGRLARADASPAERISAARSAPPLASASRCAADARRGGGGPVLAALRARLLWLESHVPDAVLAAGDGERSDGLEWASARSKLRLAWRTLVRDAPTAAELMVALVVFEDALPRALRLSTSPVPVRGARAGEEEAHARAALLETHTSAADVALRLHWIEYSFRRHDAEYRAALVAQLFT